MSRDDRHADLRRRLVEIAVEQLATDGLAGVQARKLAAATSISVGTLYNACGNLDNIIVEANMITVGRLGQALESVALETEGLEISTRLRAMALAYLAFAVEHTPSWRALFEHRFSNGRDVPTVYREQQAEVFAIVERVLATGIADGTIRERAARALFGAVHGIAALALDEKLGAFDNARTQAEIELLVAAFGKGLPNTSASA
ncbi:MAG: TetR/AcrR family transcriptional regulator [Hyphomicrobiaceae bacterium]